MKPTILVVDDEELVRWSLRQRLEPAEYQVIEAATGEAAIEHFRNGVDLVLLDYGLPDTNGMCSSRSRAWRARTSRRRRVVSSAFSTRTATSSRLKGLRA